MKPKPLDLEDLASIEHEQWIEWSKAVAGEVSRDRAKRWEAYWIPYKQLPDGVKEQDRAYAKKVLERIKSACEFYLKYKDNPKQLVQEQEDILDLSDTQTQFLVRQKDSFYTETAILEYNEWLFKLAFKDVFREESK